MTQDNSWRIWDKDITIEGTLVKRATGELPPMEATKQAIELISEVYQPGMSILDVGCNVGHYYKALRETFGDINYLGVDATRHFIEKAKRFFPEARFEQADIFDLNLGTFDIVFCVNVILHLPQFRLPIRNLLEATGGGLLLYPNAR